MKSEQFNKLSKEEQREEINKCNSFEYFYNNYCKKEGMPEFSQETFEEYIISINKQRFSRRRLGNPNFFSFIFEAC